MPKDLDFFAHDEEIEARLARERELSEKRQLEASLKALLGAEAKKRAYQEIIAQHAPLLRVPTTSTFKVSKRAPEEVWVLVLSDWHVGQRTESQSTGYVFEQTIDITKYQVERIWQKLRLLFEIDSKSVKITELVVLVLGDIVEGDNMRPSQHRKIETVVAKQTVEASNLLTWLLQQCLTAFPKVTVHMVGGNHDRISERPGDAGLGLLDYCDTFSWLIGAFLERLFTQAIAKGRMSITNHESFFGTAVVANQRLVFEHGSSFRSSTGSYAGIPFYGIYNAARGYGEMLGGIDLMVMGHYHQPIILPHQGAFGWQILNGALPPSTHFVQSNFKKLARPSQTLLKLHHEQGLIDWSPIYLEHPHMKQPGEFWTEVHGDHDEQQHVP